MKKKECDLCTKKFLQTDRFLFENKYGIFVRNPMMFFKFKGIVYKTTKRRFSAILHKHVKKPTTSELRSLKKFFKEYLFTKHALVYKKDYDFFVTMTTYPDHFHIHAIPYPFKAVKEKISMKKIG